MSRQDCLEQCPVQRWATDRVCVNGAVTRRALDELDVAQALAVEAELSAVHSGGDVTKDDALSGDGSRSEIAERRTDTQNALAIGETALATCSGVLDGQCTGEAPHEAKNYKFDPDVQL
jgi:hypothetical protein